MMIVIKDDDDSYDSIFWNLHNLHNDSPILSGRLKTEKIGKLLVLKQALKYGLVLEKVHRVIKFGQKAWLKSYIDLNTELRKNAKSDFEKYFFKIMSNAAFEKTIGNLRKHRDIKIVTTEERRNYLVSESNYHTTKSCKTLET